MCRRIASAFVSMAASTNFQQDMKFRDIHIYTESFNTAVFYIQCFFKPYRVFVPPTVAATTNIGHLVSSLISASDNVRFSGITSSFISISKFTLPLLHNKFLRMDGCIVYEQPSRLPNPFFTHLIA